MTAPTKRTAARLAARTRRRGRVAAIASAALCVAMAVAVPAAAWGDHGLPVGADFGVTDAHNGPSDPGFDVSAPAFPLAAGESVSKAWWAGACDLHGASTSDGGIGSPPAVLAHCIDHGDQDRSGSPSRRVWNEGAEPAWRLDPFTQAGGRPDASGSFWMVRYPDLVDTGAATSVLAAPDGDPRTIVAELPPGVVGNPSAVPKCSSVDLRTVPPTCPPETQVGALTVSFGQPQVPLRDSVFPVFNAQARDGKVAEFMVSPLANAARANVPLVARARTGGPNGDFGVDAVAVQIPGGIPVMGQTLTLWGVPWAASHDTYRPPAGYTGHVDPADNFNSHGGVPEGGLPDPQGVQPVSYQSGWGPIRPFLANPTRCTTEPLVTWLELNSWQNPGEVKRYRAPADAAIDGCEQVPFAPQFSLEPASSVAGAPTGVSVELSVPQNNDPPAAVAENPDDAAGAPAHWRSQAGLATAHLKDATVTLADGMAVNPASANGLAACSSAQIGLLGTDFPDPAPIRFDRSEPSCPDGSKIGTVEVVTPLLDDPATAGVEDPLTGEVYLARQGDNPFSTLLALYIVVRSEERGLLVKLAGRVDPHPRTGRLTATFADGPQLPFSTFKLDFKGGPNAPLLNPADCGVHRTSWTLEAWTGRSVSGADPFAVDRGCGPLGFDPAFTAGSVEPIAGTFSPFAMRILRERANDREVGRVNVTLPSGALADLSGVPVCDEASLAAAIGRSGAGARATPACPAASQVGTTTVGAGGGGQGAGRYYPLLPGGQASGRVFLTGPHAASEFRLPGARQAAYGLAIEVPAVAGPFDLGNVIVRAAIYVDPASARISVLSDTLPRILDGIPLNVRDIRVNVDRPNFAATPTSCRVQQVVGDIRAQDNTAALKRARYQVGQCQRLGFRPRLRLRLAGRRQTKTNGHPAVRARLTQKAAEAGIRHARVRLPKSLALDPANAQALCEYEDGIRPDLEDHCPPASIVGRARAVSPLLKRPLAGDVYFVKNIRVDRDTGNEIRTLPMIIVALRGEAAINLQGQSSTTKTGKLVNTFKGVPDAPIARFALNLKGGRNGILTVTRTRRGNIDICARPQTAQTAWAAHNSKHHRTDIRVKTPCATRRANRRNGRR